MWLSAPLRTTRAMVSAQNCEPGSWPMPRRQSCSSRRIRFTLSDCVWSRISMSYQSTVKSSSGVGDHTTPAVQDVLVSGFSVRSEEHTSELQSLRRISYAVFCLKKKKSQQTIQHRQTNNNN